MKFKWVKMPVIEKLNPITVYEHTPLYVDKEYPRFIRPVATPLKTEWVKLYEDGTIKRI